jgi:predicted amidophosphoribosyltransferase
MINMKTCPKCKTELQNLSAIGDYCPNKDCNVIDNLVTLGQLTADNPYSKRYDMYTRESVVQECIDVIMNSGDMHRKEYFADLLKKHFGLNYEHTRKSI